MKSVIACFAIASVLGGCTAANKKAGLLGGTSLLAGGGVVAIGASMKDCSAQHMDDIWFNGTGCDIDKGLMISAGVVAAVVGIAVLVAAGTAPDAPERPEPLTMDARTMAIIATLPPVQPPTTDPELHRFTLQASMVARTGQCVAVQAIAKRVEDRDLGYRFGGFLGDPLVAACLK
jgi:hypothetical protein